MVQAAEKPGPAQQAQKISGSEVAKHLQPVIRFIFCHSFKSVCFLWPALNHEVDVKDAFSTHFEMYFFFHDLFRLQI